MAKTAKKAKTQASAKSAKFGLVGVTKPDHDLVRFLIKLAISDRFREAFAENPELVMTRAKLPAESKMAILRRQNAVIKRRLVLSNQSSGTPLSKMKKR